MKHKVKIPKKLKVAGHSYKVCRNPQLTKELESEGYRGSHSDFLRVIEMRDDLSDEETSCTFVHECIHACDVVFCCAHLSESDIKGMANGLHQILEQLGVRFVK